MNTEHIYPQLTFKFDKNTKTKQFLMQFNRRTEQSKLSSKQQKP